MGGYNPERLGAEIVDYIGLAYAPQFIMQSIENRLARGDLQRAIQAKCGSTGASNAAELEKELLQLDPMSKGRFGLRTSDTGTWRFRIPYTQRRIPFFWGPKNPFLLTWEAGHRLGERQAQIDMAMDIKDPILRQKALDAIGNKPYYWAGLETGLALFLVDYNRGFGLTSRIPFVNRWSSLGSNSDYQKLLKEVTEGRVDPETGVRTGGIQCNGGGSGGDRRSASH